MQKNVELNYLIQILMVTLNDIVTIFVNFYNSIFIVYHSLEMYF